MTVLTLVSEKDHSDQMVKASAALRPTVQSALALRDFNSGVFPDLGLTELV